MCQKKPLNLPPPIPTSNTLEHEKNLQGRFLVLQNPLLILAINEFQLLKINFRVFSWCCGNHFCVLVNLEFLVPRHLVIAAPKKSSCLKFNCLEQFIIKQEYYFFTTNLLYKKFKYLTPLLVRAKPYNLRRGPQHQHKP